ncbi:hypothetical protein KY342_02800 [Candidatus Woesearchaeota archaeon]|nr:hypothetical protein [Candidatus Woesearchaeota archaeon]
MGITELINREQEYNFESDSAKLQYLDNMLNTYQEHERQIVKARRVDYGLRVTRPDGKLLYFGGSQGILDRRIFDQFVQDLVSLSALLELSKSNLSKAETFNDKLLEYVIHLDTYGLIHPPEIAISNPTPEKTLKIKEQLELANLTWPAEYISKLGKCFFELWLPKIQKNTGEYDSCHIKEKILLTVKDASK